MAFQDKLILTAAITGAELSREQCPALPITPEEQANEAEACLKAGASILHLHVRDDEGHASQELAHFERTVKAIRAKCGAAPILQFSTGGAVGEKIERRLAPLALKPEMASFNLGTINFGEDIFVNTFADMRGLAKAMQQHKIVPEYEIYDAGHVDNLKKLAKERVIEAPFFCQFVLGVPGALAGEIDHLVHLVRSLPQESHWAVAGIGRYELPLAVHAIVMGGHVRVGLEDNIYFSRGVKATGNAQLVDRIARISRECGREIATPQEAREMLGLR